MVDLKTPKGHLEDKFSTWDLYYKRVKCPPIFLLHNAQHKVLRSMVSYKAVTK